MAGGQRSSQTRIEQSMVGDEPLPASRNKREANQLKSIRAIKCCIVNLSTIASYYIQQPPPSQYIGQLIET